MSILCEELKVDELWIGYDNRDSTALNEVYGICVYGPTIEITHPNGGKTICKMSEIGNYIPAPIVYEEITDMQSTSTWKAAFDNGDIKIPTINRFPDTHKSPERLMLESTEATRIAAQKELFENNKAFKEYMEYISNDQARKILMQQRFEKWKGFRKGDVLRVVQCPKDCKELLGAIYKVECNHTDLFFTNKVLALNELENSGFKQVIGFKIKVDQAGNVYSSNGWDFEKVEK